ncbi:hypothetical protein SAMN04488134_103115 [Amphibacillus marinus]|uniref:DUF4145 domain-containing protein n=1 Tax=Amphibacillus marinus TaxID=872970 RepID=A0A1H8L8T1_9BACI|nr:hypothetical protein [Amphibacillus marinus]SEO01206.1 hypothetical protein SAMN04488134_103115 [Amphibacillus marinus]
MQLLNFINTTQLDNCVEVERAKLLCFYHYKETGEGIFTMTQIKNLMIESGYNAPNPSRLKNKLLKGKDKIFLPEKKDKSKFIFISAKLQELESSLNELWDDTETIDSDSELLEESKFCGKRKYLDKLIHQINHSYAHNCYDACAVLMRRLFEVALVLSFQHYNIDDDIKNKSDSGYIMLEGIVKNAKNNKTLKLSRIKNEFDTFRKVGNFSAHNITYTAGKKDIDDIKLNYRVMLEELFNKSGFPV